MAHATSTALKEIGLPTEFIKKDNSSIDASTALAGAKYIGVYFSAHWCPPCRGFTPALSEWVSKNASKLDLSVIFASRDNSETDFKSYFGEMSWDFAIPPSSPAVKNMMSKYGIRGIPTFIIFDQEGNVVTKDGRSKVSSDPNATAFPWKPKLFAQTLAELRVVDKEGKPLPEGYLKSLDYIGLYSSAHWCPPCRAFTPALADWYKSYLGEGAPFHGKGDIFFVSSDRSESDFNSYFAEMPWKAVNYADRAAAEEINGALGVEGIPNLVFVDKEGNQIIKDGTTKVTADPSGFPWPPKPWGYLQDVVSELDDIPAVIMFLDTITDETNEKAAMDAFDAVATEYFVDGRPHPTLRFALANDADDALQLRRFLGKSHQADRDGATNVRVTIVDMPNQKKCLFNGGALGVPTKDSLSAWVKSFLDGSAASVGIKA